MKIFARAAALVVFWLMATIAWVILGGTTAERTQTAQWELSQGVSELWGEPLVQPGPVLRTSWKERSEREEPVAGVDGKGSTVTITSWIDRFADGDPRATTVNAGVRSDLRRKGLLWFSLYDLDFSGTWTVENDRTDATAVAFRLPLPSGAGLYDDLRVSVDGSSVEPRLETSAEGTVIAVDLPIETVPHTVAVQYRSRGRDTWTYQPTVGVGQVEAFQLSLTTDFRDLDFPPGTMSPSTRERADGGESLTWSFARLVSSQGMGVVTPTRIQPGELASEMSFSAPISLGFFMLWLFVLGLLRGIDLHPINHLFLAAAFFSFHLLFAYTADRLPVEGAFALASVVSVTLVVSYLRLVVGPAFALREAGLAQLLYLVGFSLAHFWDGYTGLTVTVLGILTLFVLMQMTGRIRWSEMLAARTQAA